MFSASSQESAFGVNCIPIHKRLKCIGFLHMTRHYEPVHEAAKHGGGRVFKSDLVPIMHDITFLTINLIQEKVQGPLEIDSEVILPLFGE